jgi:hypothetical protein
MDEEIRMLFELLEGEDKEARYKAFVLLLEAMEEKVDWAYEIWDSWLEKLTSPDAHQRAIAGQFLCYLSISDPEKRLLSDFDKVWAVTYDEKFVTVRHTIQASWRVGLAGEEMRHVLFEKYGKRFEEAANEKNGTLIRSDITKNLKQLYDVIKDVEIKQFSLSLIDLEEDSRYRQKYEKVWR